MGLAARRRLAVLVPWAAVAALTVFALAQIRARHEAEERAAPPPIPSGNVPVSTPVDGSVDASVGAPEVRVLAEARGTLEAARAAGDALDAVLVDLAASKSAAREATVEGRAARDRAEATAAALAVAQARLDAADAAEGDRKAVGDQERQALLAQVAELGERLAVREKPPLGWLADAASGDSKRLAAARGAASSASPEDARLLLERLLEDPTLSDAGAALVPHLPAGPQVAELAVAVLQAPGGSARRVRMVGADVLAREGVLLGVLSGGAPEVVAESLKLLAGRMPELTASDRRSLCDRIKERLERPGDWPVATPLALVAALRLEGLAATVAARLGDGDPSTRAAAAHALSRVPDVEGARGAAVEALPGLLMDASLDARIAGLHLAEALLERTIEGYDPSAGDARRREAANRILDEL